MSCALFSKQLGVAAHSVVGAALVGAAEDGAAVLGATDVGEDVVGGPVHEEQRGVLGFALRSGSVVTLQPEEANIPVTVSVASILTPQPQRSWLRAEAPSNLEAADNKKSDKGMA